MRNKFTANSYVNYGALSKDGTIVRNFVNTACYAGITYSPIPEDYHIIRTIVNKEITPFELEEIEKYFKYMGIIGFPMYVKEVNGKYECDILVDDYRNSRIKFNSALTILRYISHSPFQKIVYQFLTEIKNYRKKESVFRIFEKAHGEFKSWKDAPKVLKDIIEGPYNSGYGNTNHRLKKADSVLGYDVINKRFNECIQDLSDADVSVNLTWS